MHTLRTNSISGRRRAGGRRAALAAAGAIAVAASAARGQSTFTGAGGNSNWSNGGNWSPAPPAAGDNVLIPDATAQATLTLDDAAHTIGSLTFGDTGTRVTAFTIAGGANALTLNGGLTANPTAATASGFLTVSAPTIIGADQTWTIGGTAATVTVDNGVLFSAGTVTPNAFTLNGTLTKAGTGTLLLTGRTIGAGSIDVTAGSLKLNAGSGKEMASTGAGTITVRNGATLMLSKNSGTFNLTKAITIEAGGTLNPGGTGSTGALDTVTSPIGWTGATGSLLAGSASTFAFTLAGNMTGSTSTTLTFNTSSNQTAGSRSLVLAGDNSGLASTIANATALSVLVVGSDTALGTGLYRVTNTSGSATLRADASNRTLANPVDLANSATFGLAATGDLDFAATNTIGSITGFGIGTGAKTVSINNARTRVALVTGGTTTNALTKAGPGILEFYGPNTYTRPTTITAGTLQVTGNGRIGSSGATNTYAVTVADAGLLDEQVAGLADTASLAVTSSDPTAEVNLAAGVNDTVNTLFVNGVAMTPGTYGSTASGATNAGLASPDDVFSGAGRLNVLSVPEPASAAAATVAVAGLLAARRRRRG